MTEHARIRKAAASRRSPARASRRKRRPDARYFAFLSYSHKDSELADWLHRELEQFRVPSALVGRITEHGAIPRRLAPIFRDERELAAAGDLGEEIEEALSSSHFLIVLCSPNAARSHWTNAEIDTFKRTRPDGCVLAAIADGEPFASLSPDSGSEECFPPALLFRYDRLGRPTAKRAEPLAADLRGDGEAKRTGFLKLVAGMLGVGLDELVQRETTRRQRRLAWLSAASIAGMALTSMLAVTAIQARDEARDQRREAEGLVAFMLGDLKDKLEPIGRLDALDGVGARVLDYYAKQDASQLSDAALLQRSRALGLSAQVAYRRGNIETAVKLYREATAGTAEALQRSPDDAQRLFDHAQNIFWTGELARSVGRIGEAETAFREYRRLADRMTAIDKDNLKWRMEVQFARENLGIVLMAQRRFTEAAGQFASAAAVIQSLAALNPENREYQSEYANVLAWLADARVAEGKLAEAAAIRNRQIAFLEAMVRARANDVLFRERLVPAYQSLATLQSWQGEPAKGLANFERGLRHGEALLSLEPENSTWQDLTASIRLEHGRLLSRVGRGNEAQAKIASACAMAAELGQRAANVARWRKLNTNCLSLQAEMAVRKGAHAEALSRAEQALRSASNERGGDSIETRYRVAAAHRLRGQILLRWGNRAAAQQSFAQGLGQLPRGVFERPSEMSERAALLRMAGRNDEWRQLQSRLTAMGYKTEIR